MPSPLENFIIFYALISFSYLLYKYIFAVTNFQVYGGKNRFAPSVSIIMPCYNEDGRYLKESVISACRANYPDKEIIIVDDGSTNKETQEILNGLKRKYCFKLVTFEKNRGKKHAMAKGFRMSKGEVIITMDSDSVIPSGASIRELVRPLSDKSVGSVSGCIMVKNRHTNLMTKIQDARYWLAFNIEKLSQDPYDSVTCTSGPFSAHRKKYLMKYLGKWENQVFLDTKCNYGDDRGLTTFMLKAGYKVKFAKNALSYTNVPETLGKFLKQQVRWKKSFCRENWYLLKFIHKRSIFANIEFYLFWLVFLAGFVAKVVTLYYLLNNPYNAVGFIIMILFVSMLHYVYLFIKHPGTRGIYGMFYGFLNEFILGWLFFIALFTLKDSKWGTR